MVDGEGLLSEPSGTIDCGNSGTTMRLISGVLSGNPFRSVLTGDESLSRRPMKRVIEPLRMMGADISASSDDNYPPLSITGGGLRPITYEMPVASAQVKSAVMLAGLYAEGETVVMEKARSRDHTERMLPAYGADVRAEGLRVSVKGGPEMRAVDMEVPGDFSSAAFFVVAAAITRGSELLIRNTGINPTRAGLLKVLADMGARISVENVRHVSGEPVGDIVCSYSRLRGVDVDPEMVPSLIDEFPVLCVAAALAEGVTSIRGAGELRVKESDRISVVANALRAMGVEVDEFPDGMSIKGRESLKGAVIDSMGDHRVAMSFAVASLAAEDVTVIDRSEAVNVSFPGFFDILRRVSVG
jgi:3-phosphoshikimate 1-carboxyvinyltransferase